MNGIVTQFNVAFGPGSRRGFEEDLRDARAHNRFLTALPAPPIPEARVGPSPKPKPVRKPRPAPADTRPDLAQVLALTDAFCHEHLNEEYAVLCGELAGKLAAKRPSPLLQGRLETWACGIIRTIGWVNFLADRSQSPHLKMPVIDRAFGVAESTGQGKAKAIRRLLKIHQFDHRWVLPSQWENHPLIWTLQDSRGFMVDIRNEPLEMQRAAFKQGLIPFVPADRRAKAAGE